MIKILQVVNIFGGAVGQILLDLMPRLMKEFDVRIVSIQPINLTDPKVNECINKYHKLETLNIDRFSVLKAYYHLKKYINQINPEIIHSHMGRSDILTALLKPKDTVILNTFHCEKKNHTILTQIGYWMTDKRMDWRICISKTVESSYYLNPGFKSLHSVIYNPVKMEKFVGSYSKTDLKIRYGFKENDKILLSTGRLIRSKGQKYLIEMMPYIVKLLPEVKLLIIGDGPLRNSLERQIRRLNLTKKIFLLGYRHDIPDLLKAADLFVYSAQWEGLAIAVIEAMASRIPVIAHPIPSLQEYIVDEESGFFCNIHSRVEFAEKIHDILIYNKKITQISENAFQTASQMFSVEKIANQYVNLYRKLWVMKNKKND